MEANNSHDTESAASATSIPLTAEEELHDANYHISRILCAESIYDVLDVQQDINNGVGLRSKKVKDNFQKMARVIHPDRCVHENASVAFSKLRRAYEEISNDLINPRPVVPVLPSPDVKPRRQVATTTSRLLRGAANEELLQTDTSSRNDLTALRRYCSTGKTPVKFASSIGSISEPYKMNDSLGPINISSASTPSELLSTLSPLSSTVEAAHSDACNKYYSSSSETSPIIFGMMTKCKLSGSNGSSDRCISMYPNDLSL